MFRHPPKRVQQSKIQFENNGKFDIFYLLYCHNPLYICVCVWYIMVYSISVCVCVYVSKYVNTCSNGRLSFLVPLSEVKHQPQWRVQANCQKLQSLLCSTGVHTWSFHHGKMRFNYKVEQVEPHR